MKSFLESRIKKDIYKPTYASKELPKKAGVYNVVLRSESGKGIKRKKFFNPIDENIKKEFVNSVLIWNKRIENKTGGNN